MQRNLRSFAEALRAGNPADPRAYLLLRAAAWLPITHLPPVEDGKTALPDMDGDAVAGLENRLKAGDMPAVLESAEGNFANAPYWLAAHRYSAAALARMGDDYADARAVVVGQLAAFLRRFPEVPTLRFTSGAPFADPATAAWIQDEVATAAGGGGAAGAAAWDVALSSARQAAIKGKINDAFGILTSGRQSAPSGRARFLWDLRQAEFCFDNGEVVPAARLLEILDDEYHELGLADWDPDIGLQVAELLLKCYAKAGDRLGAADGAPSARVARLQATLCRLDMTKAVTLMKP
jgi:type VI secretion system protein VasJ